MGHNELYQNGKTKEMADETNIKIFINFVKYNEKGDVFLEFKFILLLI